MKSKRNYRIKIRNKILLIFLALGILSVFLLIRNLLATKSMEIELLKTVEISIAEKGNITVDEMWSTNSRTNMLICSIGMITPNPIAVLKIEINGRSVDQNDVIFSRIVHDGRGVKYFKVKHDLFYYLHNYDQSINVHLKYKYSCLSKYQESKYDSMNMYVVDYNEMSVAAFQKVHVKENIKINVEDKSLNVDTRNFSEFSQQIEKDKNILLAREYKSNSTNSIVLIGPRYLVLTRKSSLDIGELDRQLNFINIDRVEEQINYTIQSDSSNQGVYFSIPFPDRIDISNPDISININGNVHKPFPIDSLMRGRLITGELPAPNTFYYYSGAVPNRIPNQYSENRIETFCRFPGKLIANTEIKIQYNPSRSGILTKLDYFNYQLKYYLGHLADFNRQDNLYVFLPSDYVFSEIVNHREYIKDSSSTAISYKWMNQRNFDRVPIILNIQREGVVTANLLRLFNISLSILLLIFVILKLIKKQLSPIELMISKKWLWPVVTFILLSIEFGYIFTLSDALEIILYIYYWVPFVLIVPFSILFYWPPGRISGE